MRAPIIRERDVLKACMDWLKIKRVFHYRQNTGAHAANYKGTDRFIRYGVPGAPDIVAVKQLWFHERDTGLLKTLAEYVAIEVKAPSGEQSVAQKQFQANLEAAGGRYILVHSVEELIEKW